MSSSDTAEYDGEISSSSSSEKKTIKKFKISNKNLCSFDSDSDIDDHPKYFKRSTYEIKKENDCFVKMLSDIRMTSIKNSTFFKHFVENQLKEVVNELYIRSIFD